MRNIRKWIRSVLDVPVDLRYTSYVLKLSGDSGHVMHDICCSQVRGDEFLHTDSDWMGVWCQLTNYRSVDLKVRTEHL